MLTEERGNIPDWRALTCGPWPFSPGGHGALVDEKGIGPGRGFRTIP